MSDEKDLTVKEAFDLAIQNHQNKNLQEAQSYYQKVLKIDPNYIAAINNLGIIFKELGESQKAKSYYEKAIEIDSSYAHAHNNLGNLLLKELKRNEEAKICLEKAIEIDSNYAHAHNNLGIVFQELGEHHKARDCYKKAIEIDPNYSEAHNNLGIVFQELGEHHKARDCYEKTIELNPNYADVHFNLGVMFQELKENQKAKDCYEKTIELNPNHIDAYNNLSIVLGSYTFDYKSKKDKIGFKKLIISLFNKDIVETRSLFENAKSILFSDDEQNQLEEAINSDSLLSNKVLQRLLKEELFHLLLQKSILTDIFLEKLLTQLRCEILFNLKNSNTNNLEEYFNFINSLAEQCWLNEFLYIQSVNEVNLIDKLKQKIENDEEIDELQISILGCYIPLNSSKNIIGRLLNYKSLNLLFNDLISLQIKEPLKEKELAKSIRSLTEIIDPMSKKVQEQYEEHPYPRWRFTREYLIKNSFEYLNGDINPNKINYNNKFDNPNVLIAGCGTGRHSISANRFKNANILAVDLSKSSLAYAKRKTEELGFKNIEYLHADILQLKKLNKKFDIIESSGVLHHMKEPITGLKMLLDILEPHGFLKIGLYSEIARRNITEIRKFIKNKNYKGTNKDILACRQDILDKKVDPLIQKVTAYLDFYSTSMTRDLLFHVQEHQFTIPQISKILKDLNLEFLGFVFQNTLIKKEYFRIFPGDKKNISLDNWHQFEINNPDTFFGMYQFWVRKI